MLSFLGIPTLRPRAHSCLFVRLRDFSPPTSTSTTKSPEDANAEPKQLTSAD